MEKKIAVDLGPVNESSVGNQRLYQLKPPMKYEDGYGEDAKKKTAKFVVVSAVAVMCTGAETYIFPADKKGKITDWGELDGSYRGGLDHEQALHNAGYTVEGEIKR